jgi:uncharacterized protein
MTVPIKKLSIRPFAGTYDKKDLDETLGELDELIEKEMLFAPMTENFKVVAEEEPVIKSLMPEHRARLQPAL